MQRFVLRYRVNSTHIWSADPFLQIFQLELLFSSSRSGHFRSPITCTICRLHTFYHNIIKQQAIAYSNITNVRVYLLSNLVSRYLVHNNIMPCYCAADDKLNKITIVLILKRYQFLSFFHRYQNIVVFNM